MTKYLDDRERIYFYNLCWDVVMVMVYYFIPVFFFGVHVDRYRIVGLLMMLGGLALMKMKGTP